VTAHGTSEAAAAVDKPGADGRARPLVRTVDLVVRPGEVVAVVGANGTGKSTLLRTVTGHLEPLCCRSVRSGRLGRCARRRPTSPGR
jgi:ABC-type hemin transport system ATPase subunit